MPTTTDTATATKMLISIRDRYISVPVTSVSVSIPLDDDGEPRDWSNVEAVARHAANEWMATTVNDTYYAFVNDGDPEGDTEPYHYRAYNGGRTLPTGIVDDMDNEVGWWLSLVHAHTCLLYTSPSPRDRQKSRMPSSA